MGKIWTLLLVCSLSILSFQQGVLAQYDDFGGDLDDWNDADLEALESEFDLEGESTPPPPPAPTKSTPAPEKQPSVEKTEAPKPAAVTTQQPATSTPSSSVSTTPAPAPVPAPVSTPEPTLAPSPSIPTVASGTSVLRAGPPLILITRPVYAPYSTEDKTMYIAAVSEAYFHLKIGALPGIQVISQEKIANNVQYFRDFSRRISRTSYIDAAKKLGATYLFYQEYEPQGKKVKFNLELYSIAENKRLTSSTQEFAIQEIENGLFDCVNEIATALVGTISSDVQTILATDVLGKNSKAIETFGNQIVSVGDFSQKRAENAVNGFEKLANQNSQMHAARFITAAICSRAKQYDKAISHQKKLISTFGSSYPALYLQLASYYRQGGKYNDALDAAEQAVSENSLELPAKAEIARIHEAKGDLSRAKSEYLSVLEKGGEDGEIYFQLALVSIGLNDLSGSSSYLSKAASAGRELDRGDYYDLGLRYAALGSANDQAIEAFRKSLGIQQDNEDAWRQMAELYSRMRQDSAAAECYISLFHINNEAYKDYLPKAGMMFEGLGMTERAKDVYSLFLARRYTDVEVSVRLAKIEVQEGNCKRAVELVDGMDTLPSVGMEVKRIMEQCGQPERRVVVATGTGDKKWVPVFIWRVASGVLTAGAIGVGYFCDMQVAEKYDQYQQDKEKGKGDYGNYVYINDLHNQIEKWKNYRNYSYIGAGIAGLSFAVSIPLPIIFSNR
jgi:tetratricopeptide (TPR) repeat protein